MARVAFLAAALLGAQAVACSARQATAPAPPADTVAPAASAPSAVAPAPRSAQATDPLWLAARGGDDLERARLAQVVGATGLLEALQDGGETTALALAALPDAPDGDLALRTLGELAAAPAGGPVDAHAALVTMLAIASQPRRDRELLDPDGVRAAAATLVALAGRHELPDEDRALAVSAARALAERGYVDPARIPADLDPK